MSDNTDNSSISHDLLSQVNDNSCPETDTIQYPSTVIEDTLLPKIVEIELKHSPSPLCFMYEVVYPNEINLKPSPTALKPRGRPKKGKTKDDKPQSHLPEKSKVKVVQKTRSGRAVKFPKHIEQDFKKIEINDEPSTNPTEEIRISDFTQYIDEPSKLLKTQPRIIEHVELQNKKRKISHQYRCPKCKKAYLGKSKILEHLKKNPDHGPFQQNEENKNFEVWNYLVSITQKCPSSERGTKFCQELTNVLHNLLLLTNALFKKLGSVTNEVKIDKVLGNAIGLSPGSYYFDDNNLYKDVTVLKLMSNNDFFNSLRTKNEEHHTEIASNSTEPNCNCGKTENFNNPVSTNIRSMSQLVIKGDENSINIKSERDVSSQTFSKKEKNDENIASDKNNSIEYFYSNNLNLQHTNFSENDYEMKTELSSECEISPDGSCKMIHNNEIPKPNCPDTLTCQTNLKLFKSKTQIQNKNTEKINATDHSENSSKHPVNPDLISDNSVHAPISSIRHSVDELMLPVSETSNLLDNSSSSDEVMNVDQFVNERFKKITEPEMEATNSTSLNLDLPSLELFQFHTN